MQSAVPELLTTRLSKHQCVAFVGAGFSMACGMPGWRGFVQALIDSARRAQSASDLILNDCAATLKEGRLEQVADRLRHLISPADYDDTIRDQFGLHVLHRATPDQRLQMEERMSNLTRGPWAGIITTNYDELIETAIGQFVSKEVIKARGDDPRLGGVLSSAPLSTLFFVKAHGSVDVSKIVLTTKDYCDMYITSEAMTIFMCAMMLRYHVVFIGCSLEDEVLRIRRRLTGLFRGMVPIAYALVQEGTFSETSRQSLQKEAGISVLEYAKDCKHQGVDQFLAYTAGIKNIVNPK